MAEQEPQREVPTVSVTSSQGVFAGSGNQYNNWMSKPALDPAAMRHVSPHLAVTWLQELDHRELVRFFAGASPDDVGGILEVFAEVDLSRVVATLGDISRVKANQLISAADTHYILADLDGLPGAAVAIARTATRLGWAHAEPLEHFIDGYAKKYDNGHIFWSERFGVMRTTGAIDGCWTESGFPWGFPADDQKTSPTSPYGTTGNRQKFQPSTVYSSKHGVFLITDALCYEGEGGSGGWLGFPVSGRERNGQLGDLQMFEGGAIYSYMVEGPEALRSFAVRREVADVLRDSRPWRPVSKVTHTVSSSGTPSAIQHFEVGLETGTCATAVYSSKHYGPVIVAPEVWDYYSNLDAEKSWLGFPIGQRQVTLPTRLGLGFQRFQVGRIYWQQRISPIAVRAEVVELTEIHDSLGYPASDEQPFGVDGSDCIQFFEAGVVTCRNGKYEVWVHPDSKPESPVESDTTATPNGTPAPPRRTTTG